MKTNIISRTLFSAMLAITFTAPAVAGPGQIYVPVPSMREAEEIKPGARIAMECPNCGGLTTTTADEDRTYLHSYICETCKKKFVVRADPHGGTRGAYLCEDEAGNRARLLRAK